MPVPDFIVKLFSHFFEWHITELSSPHNAQLKVVMHRGRYKLITDGAIYSFEDLYSNYRLSFERLRWSERSIKSCLVLGLGLGSIPDMLISKFGKQMEFSAVEIDEAVIFLANKYVLQPKNIKVEIFSADAGSFLALHQGKYDMICSDVFVGDQIPESLQTEEALSQMRDLLAPKGLLLFNRLNRFASETAQNQQFFSDVFQKVFPLGGHIDVQGNWMFVSDISAFSDG